MKKFVFIGLLSLFLTSCSKKVFEPIYTSIPKLEEIPSLTLVDSIVKPIAKDEILSIHLFNSTKPSKEDYFNTPGAKIHFGKPPSVLIAVPKEVIVSGKKQKEFSETDTHNLFRTDGYFNEEEQVIEQALLRHGFNVLDRSKFEAKLRDLRDNANKKPWYWNDWTSKLLESGEYEVVKEEYKKQFEEGTITGIQLSEVVAAIEKEKNKASVGKKREEDEMNDIAEVIRAAQTGENQADYLLQINEVSISKIERKNISIKNLPEVKRFLKQNKGLRIGTSSNDIPKSVSISWLKTSFNAKLIDVKTGSIVWIGSHDIESDNAEEIALTFTVKKEVANDKSVNGKIAAFNKEIAKLKADLVLTEKELNAFYREASRKRKFANSDEMKNYKKRLVFNIEILENKYAQSQEKLKAKLTNPPKFETNPWEFSYDVALPIITPNFKDKVIQHLQDHQKKLVKAVVKQLIETINITRQ